MMRDERDRATSDDDQRATTLTLLKGLGYSVDKALLWLDVYTHRYADRMSWADFRRIVNQAAADGFGPCPEHRPAWPDLPAEQILADHEPRAADEVAAFCAGVYDRRRN